MEAQFQGYPLAVFYVAAFIGVVLICYRPQWAFLFVVFCLSFRNYHMAVYTRTPIVGEYLNLNDLFLWIGVGALIMTALQNRKIWAPNILLAIIGILLLGTFQTFLLHGFDYFVLREIWASWIFPLVFIVAANLIRTNEDCRLFIWALFWGAFGAAVQHILTIQSSLMEPENIVGLYGIRNISFMYSGGIFLVIGTLFIDIRKIVQGYYLYLLWIIGLSLIGISYLLSFTRTIWVGSLLTIAVLFLMLYRDKRKIYFRFSYSIVLIVVFFLVYHFTNELFLKDAEITQLIEERAEFAQFEESFEEAYGTREAGIKTELGLWLDGSILWGLGAAYPPSLQTIHNAEERYIKLGALNHVAFSSYLAHFGLIGLLTFGFFLPFLAINLGRRLYVQYPQGYGGIVAVAAISLALFNIFTLGSGFHYLAPTTHVQSLIYGALWGVSRSLRAPVASRAEGRTRLPHSGSRWLPGQANL